MVERACRLIEHSEKMPSLSALAESVGRSESHLHRLFKTATGLTPRGYAQARRAARLRAGLAYGSHDVDSVTTAMYDAGFGSSGNFYAQSTDLLGMTPSRYRSGGVDETLRFAIGQSSLGAILVASSEKGVAAILLSDDPDGLARDLQDRFPKARLIGADAGYEALVAQVVGFVEMPARGLDLRLDVRCTAFQQRVWTALQRIPVGGKRMSVAMTGCGPLGWTSDADGYRYAPLDPQSGRPWPEMPRMLLRAPIASISLGLP